MKIRDGFVDTIGNTLISFGRPWSPRLQPPAGRTQPGGSVRMRGDIVKDAEERGS